MQTSIKIQSLPFDNAATYIAAGFFVAGNIVFPQLFHLVHLGGVTWLPIYFFTLVGACIYGWRTGLLTALASPVANALLFGMPAVAALPVIMMKSVLLALIAGCVTARAGRVSLLMLAAIVLGYQIVGTAGEWLLCGDFYVACQDFRMGVPGMLLQIFGGYAVLRQLTKSGSVI